MVESSKQEESPRRHTEQYKQQTTRIASTVSQIGSMS